jgi:hypothetical protein
MMWCSHITASGAISALENERQHELDRLMSIDAHHLPALLSKREGITAEEQRVRLNAQELQQRAAGVQEQQHQAKARKEALLAE